MTSEIGSIQSGEEIPVLVIRKEQIAVFQDYAAKEFENHMVTHVKQYFPDVCALLGQEKVREAIAYGLNRAETYGMTLEYDVSRYINLMFTFGRDYDMDPTLPWAAKILGDNRLSGPAKMDELYEEAERYLPEAISIGKRI